MAERGLADDVHHALDHLAGQVLEVLGHQDLQQLLLGGLKRHATYRWYSEA